MKIIKIFTFIFLMLFIAGCSDSPVSNKSAPSETSLYEKPGLVDSLAGTCSAYMVRTIIIDSLDTRNYNNLRIESFAYTDGDLSNINLYYLNAGNISNLISLEGTNQINGTINLTVPSPKIKDNYYLRLKLFASVCTGQYYHLKIRDLKIFGVN